MESYLTVPNGAMAVLFDHQEYIYIYIFGKDMTGPHVEDDEDVKIDIVIRWTNATSNP